MRDTLLIFCLNSIIVSLFHCLSHFSICTSSTFFSLFPPYLFVRYSIWFLCCTLFLEFSVSAGIFSSSFTFHHFLAYFLAFSLSLTIIVISLSHSLSCSRFFVFIRVIKYPSSLYISNYSQYSLFPHSLYSLITLFPCLFATFLHSTTRLSLSTY